MRSSTASTSVYTSLSGPSSRVALTSATKEGLEAAGNDSLDFLMAPLPEYSCHVSNVVSMEV